MKSPLRINIGIRNILVRAETFDGSLKRVEQKKPIEFPVAVRRVMIATTLNNTYRSEGRMGVRSSIHLANSLQNNRSLC